MMAKKRSLSFASVDSSLQYRLKESENWAKTSSYDSILFSESSLLSFPSDMFDPFSRKRKRFSDWKAKKHKNRDKSLDAHYKYTLNRMHKEDFRKRIVDIVINPILASGESLQNVNKLLQFQHYIQTGVDTLHVAPLEDSSLEKILSFVPEKYKTNFPQLTKILIAQVQEEFRCAIKKSIIEFSLNQLSIEETPEVGLNYFFYL